MAPTTTLHDELSNGPTIWGGSRAEILSRGQRREPWALPPPSIGGVARRRSGIPRRAHDRASRLPPPWEPPCADRNLGQGTGERWGGSTSYERAPVVWLRRWPPPAGDDSSGLAGLGFGGARRRRLRRPRVAQAERCEGFSCARVSLQLINSIVGWFGRRVRA
jgi:hypothetical protein